MPVPSRDRLICRALLGDSPSWRELDIADSNAFLHHLSEQGVMSLLHDRMHETAAWGTWPADVRQAIETRSKATVAVEMLRTHHLQHLLQAFSERGVRCLLMKGEALSQTSYNTPGTRDRCDTDLFIDLVDIEAAVDAAAAIDARIVSPIYKSHQFVALLSVPGGIEMHFDVHWRWSNHARFARTVSFEDAWEASIELSELGARALNPAHSLLLACLHRLGSSLHDSNRLIWLYDIHLLAKQLGSQQWGEFVDMAVQCNVQAVCSDGLNQAAAYFGSEIPVAARAALVVPETKPTVGSRIRDSQLGLIVDDLKDLPDTRSRLALLREYLFPPGDYLLRRYGKERRIWLPWLYVRYLATGFLERVSLR